MPKWRKRPCATCGEEHCCRASTCFHCTRRAMNAKKPRRFCAVCNRDISPGLERLSQPSSPYCSRACKEALHEAQIKAISEVSKAVKRGELVPATHFVCTDCGAPATEYEHRNYRRPLDVDPVCRSCNIKRGPADDVAEAVAEHLGISGSVAAFMRPLYEREKAHFDSLFSSDSA